ncbi:amino acid ABC transporter permease [Pseudaminobacter arsenicus]|uniref:Amino acid ABC transporter permease n=1 Tax=Borborobacter arsenicus TaxID=1851146 RepID=A0A432V1F5_9HYPH|nr:amino acid ABC transporter permease [Pseudaminobacter arsenicus]RUM96009.1 amino acid ABC transporter permease [Pseudaminobacter arsenicus]
MQAFLNNFANVDTFVSVLPLLLSGLLVTVSLALVALPLSLLSGLLVALLFAVKNRVLTAVLFVLIDLCRSIPVLVLLMIIFYALPFLGLMMPPFVAVVLTLVINNTGYFGEIFRAGLASVPKHQQEAGLALGISRPRVLLFIVVPQAIRNVAAPLASNALELAKATSIASLVTMPELLRVAQVAQANVYNPTPLVAAAALYFIVLWPFSRLVARYELKTIKARY